LDYRLIREYRGATPYNLFHNLYEKATKSIRIGGYVGTTIEWKVLLTKGFQGTR
jgi:hypothetical protein